MNRLRSRGSLARKKANVAPAKIYLLVCEDSKSSPEYFKAFKRHHRIKSANIMIYGGDQGSAPINVVQYSIDIESALKKDKHIVEKVFCIVDRDEHPTFDAARAKIENKINYKLVVSELCFEIWLLLHFTYSTAPFQRSGARSAANNVVTALKQKLATYDKSSGEKAFEDTKHLLDTALERAERLRSHCQTSNTSNPSTNLDLVIRELMAL